MTTRVTSRQNPRLKEVARLIASSRDRRKSGRCVLEGEHAIAVYLDRVGAPETLVVVEASHYGSSLEALVARVPPAHTLTVPRSIFAELASLSADVGVLAVVPTPVPAPAATGRLLPAAGRTYRILATWGRCCAVRRRLASSRCTCPRAVRLRGRPRCCAQHKVRIFNWRFARTSTWPPGPTTIAQAVAAWSLRWRPAGRRWYGEPFPARVALAIGNEGAGLSAALLAAADRRVTITMPGGTESLNAAVAAGILMFERVRQRR